MATEPLEDVTAFLLDLAEAMHGVQFPSNIIEAHLDAIASRFGVTVDPLLFQGCLAMETRGSGRSVVAVRRIDFDAHWRLERVRLMVELARDVEDRSIGLAEAHRRLKSITSMRGMYRHLIVIAAYAVYSAAVAARVGGRALEMFVAGLVGVAAGVIHFGTIRYRQVDLQKSFLAGLVGTLLTLGIAQLFPPFDYARSLFGGMTLLVPAMVIAIGAHELANASLESGVARLAYGALRFVLLGAGIIAAVKLWSFVAPIPPSRIADPMRATTVLAILVVGGAALTFCLQARLRDLPVMVFAALLAYGAQALSKSVLGNEEGAPALAAFVLGGVAHLYARASGHVPATMIVPGLLQLAPGFMGTEDVIDALGKHAGGGAFEVILVAVQLVMGLIAASVLFDRRKKRAVEEPARGPRPAWGTEGRVGER
jgi:uncharacterized membrane protein YjjP (DUF1212 family)